MSKTQTEKSRYPSRYSPGKFVTAAQFIIELICENKARSEGKDLPVKFWELDEWRKFYCSQLRYTNKLLKLYHTSVIIEVIKKRKIRSLFGKWIIKYFIEEQKIFDAKQLAKEQKQIEVEQKKIDSADIILPKVRESKRLSKDILDKLDEIEE